MSKKDGLQKLLNYRDQIEKILNEIDEVMQNDFGDEYAIAYQHWIPQIKTSLRDDTRWLPRGEYSMDYTLNRITDSMNNDLHKGVDKYIK